MRDTKPADSRPLTVELPPEIAAIESNETHETAELGYCLVTGAAGFLGRHLVFELIRRGHQVRAFDLRPIDYSHERLDCVQGDVAAFEDVRKACEGIDSIFHTAAVLDFATFATRDQRERSTTVNVLGVENVVRAARESDAKRLVHTSSNNVTLDDPVIDGDETLPYAEGARDLYTKSKILGEKIALAANDPDGLLTCAIRPGGIYGPGDKLMLPRVVAELAGGRYVATIGDGSALSDNTYIDNLVDGEIEAARHLVPGSPLAGEAYFITDGAPINYFEFFRPLVLGLGYPNPRWKVPGRLMLGIATVWEFLHWSIRIPRPVLNRLEVIKITVSHYNRIDKARRDFGWVPVVGVEEAMERCLEYCQTLHAQHETVDRPHWGWWLAIGIGMGLLGTLAISSGAHGLWREYVTVWTPRWLLGTVFVLAVLAHVRKAMEAVRLAERAGLSESSLRWGWQTFALGFASLRLLKQRLSESRSG